MVKLYFKHLYPSMADWQEPPYAPWSFDGQVLLSVLSFFESRLLNENLSLKKELGCEIFMDSGAFAAAAMGFELDPYEVAEMHQILQADIIVPLDLVVYADDSPTVVSSKIEQTVKNTEILLDYKPKNSEVIGPLQGFTKEILQESFEKFRAIGIKRFALGGVVFEPDLQSNLERIGLVREITKGYKFHVFGKFLNPKLLKCLHELKVDSTDGYGYIISSVKGLYVKDEEYVGVTTLSEEELGQCPCSACQDHSFEDFSRGNKEAQLLLVAHNVYALNELNKRLKKEFK